MVWRKRARSVKPLFCNGFLLQMAKVELRVPAIITPWRRYCGEEHVGRPTLVPPRAVPARSRSGPGRTRRIGGRHGRAGDAPLGWASPAAGAWTRAITSPRLDRPHQLDGALRKGAVRVLTAYSKTDFFVDRGESG